MKYQVTNHQTYRITNEGESEIMALFEAWISEETRYVDGHNVVETMLTIEGLQRMDPDDDEPTPLPPVRVRAQDFSSMQWVMPHWGVRAVIAPGFGTKEDLRTAIQMRSRPFRRTVYRHTGWATIGGQRYFLHRDGGIGAKGDDPSLLVELPSELSRYVLFVPDDPAESISATLRLADLGPAELMWPLIAMTLTPVYAPVDFAGHLSGRTGSFKSEIMSLLQSHFGEDMDARHLPGSWSSTANAIEAQAYICKDCVYVCDDFVPAAGWQGRAAQQSADRVVRAAGNQAGRARLTDTSQMQTTMYPRGIILSTGEDVPEGHSLRGRMMVCEVAAGDIDLRLLTKAQESRHLYPGTVGHLAMTLAREPVDLKDRIHQLRSKWRGIGHARTPGMMACLVSTLEHWLGLASSTGAISPRKAAMLTTVMTEAILTAGRTQKGYLESADQCEILCSAIRELLGSQKAHLRMVNGGIPSEATRLGWTMESGSDDVPTYRSHGPCIGWVDWDSGELMLDAVTGVPAARKQSNSGLLATKQTLGKRLKDAGLLKRTDESRQRNTVRVMAEGHPRQVLALDIAHVLEERFGELEE